MLGGRLYALAALMFVEALVYLSLLIAATSSGTLVLWIAVVGGAAHLVLALAFLIKGAAGKTTGSAFLG